jgi:hypothetical protein
MGLACYISTFVVLVWPYLDRSSLYILLVKQNLGDQMTRKEMVIWSLANDFAEMTNVGTGAGLVVEVHR